MAVGAAGAWAVRRLESSFTALLGVAYVGVVEVAALQWLSGGDSLYGALFLLWLCPCVIHSPRRALVHLAFLIGAILLPAAYHGGADEVRELVATALLVTAGGPLLIVYLTHVRSERMVLRAAAQLQRRLARVDALTGLGNQRAFDDALSVELARAERDRYPLTLGMVELGGIDGVNTRHGHLEGDRCLRDAAKVIVATLRGGDRCFRWNGTSFGLLLAGSDRATAEQVVARLRERVTTACEGPEGEPIEAWTGVAELAEVSGPDDLMDLAALELVASKSSPDG